MAMSGTNSLSDQIQDILDLVSKVVNDQEIDMGDEHRREESTVKSSQHKTVEI